MKYHVIGLIVFLGIVPLAAAVVLLTHEGPDDMTSAAIKASFVFVGSFLTAGLIALRMFRRDSVSLQQPHR